MVRMKRYSLVMSALICYILGILLGGIILTGESVFAFGFGISDSDSEEETIVARKDINIGGAPQDQEE